MRTVRCSSIGHLGCFGNQLFQYCVTKSIAESIGAKYLISPDWIGHKIFDLDDEVFHDMKDVFSLDETLSIPNNKHIDIKGFFQSFSFYLYLSISKCSSWLKVKDRWLNKFPKEKAFYIAAHMREGDFKKFHWSYPVFTEDVYIKGVVSNLGFSYLNDVIWVRENTPTIDDECEKEGIGFLPDFMKLYHSDILFRGPSTFSFWAGLLGNCQMYSPVIDFPSYGAIGLVHNVEFEKGLGIDKEGVIKL